MSGSSSRGTSGHGTTLDGTFNHCGQFDRDLRNKIYHTTFVFFGHFFRELFSGWKFEEIFLPTRLCQSRQRIERKLDFFRFEDPRVCVGRRRRRRRRRRCRRRKTRLPPDGDAISGRRHKTSLLLPLPPTPTPTPTQLKRRTYWSIREKMPPRKKNDKTAISGTFEICRRIVSFQIFGICVTAIVR